MSAPPGNFEAFLLRDDAFYPFKTSSKFGHMGPLYNPGPRKISKYLLGMSYSTCDEMTKIPPAKIGLKVSKDVP